MPSNKKVLESEWYKTNYPMLTEYVRGILGGKLQNTPDIPQWSEIDKIIQETAKTAFLEAKSPKEALDWGQAEIVKIMER